VKPKPKSQRADNRSEQSGEGAYFRVRLRGFELHLNGRGVVLICSGIAAILLAAAGAQALMHQLPH